MSAVIGKHAVVIGAGIGGLAAAGALADHFEQVTILDRDTLPRDPEHRAGVPQSRHSHIILGGGQRALDEIFPDFTKDIIAAGAVIVRSGLDDRREVGDNVPLPRRDHGFSLYSSSRPLLEFVVRRRLTQRGNVVIQDRSRVREILATPQGVARGLRFDHDHGSETLTTDFILDASGRAAPTLGFLQATGRPAPEETILGTDVAVNSAIFELPEDESRDWNLLTHYPKQPETTEAGLLVPMENRRWLLTVGGAHEGKPGGGEEGFMALLRRLRMPTLYNTIVNSKRVSEFVRFAFPTSQRKHFERLPDFPRGLLPLGDAYCFYNPVYGQGMSTATKEAVLLRHVLAAQAAEPDPIAGIAPAFFTGAQEVLETPWANACRDLLYPETTGTRPPDFQRVIMFGEALSRLAVHDPEIHKLLNAVHHMITPRSALRTPQMVERVMALTAAA